MRRRLCRADALAVGVSHESEDEEENDEELESRWKVGERVEICDPPIGGKHHHAAGRVTGHSRGRVGVEVSHPPGSPPHTIGVGPRQLLIHADDDDEEDDTVARAMFPVGSTVEVLGLDPTSLHNRRGVVTGIDVSQSGDEEECRGRVGVRFDDDGTIHGLLPAQLVREAGNPMPAVRHPSDISIGAAQGKVTEAEFEVEEAMFFSPLRGLADAQAGLGKAEDLVARVEAKQQRQRQQLFYSSDVVSTSPPAADEMVPSPAAEAGLAPPDADALEYASASGSRGSTSSHSALECASVDGSVGGSVARGSTEVADDPTTTTSSIGAADRSPARLLPPIASKAGAAGTRAWRQLQAATQQVAAAEQDVAAWTTEKEEALLLDGSLSQHAILAAAAAEDAERSLAEAIRRKELAAGAAASADRHLRSGLASSGTSPRRVTTTSGKEMSPPRPVRIIERQLRDTFRR